MKLIDADELKKAIWKAKQEHYFAFSDFTVQSIYKAIDNAPTVFSCNACKYMGNEQECVNCHDYSNYVHYDERPQGTWKRYITGYQGNKVLSITFKCSECGRSIFYVDDVDKDVVKFLSKYPYCHCGAKMEKEADEDV